MARIASMREFTGTLVRKQQIGEVANCSDNSHPIHAVK
jgi:hypothetical protein